MQQIYNRSDYNFTVRTLSDRVVAHNYRSDTWLQTTLGDVKVYDGYDRFFFVDKLGETVDEPEEEEVVEPTAAEKAREGVNEMISWIDRWSLKAPAVTEKLNEFRDQIFAAIDEMEEEAEW